MILITTLVVSFCKNGGVSFSVNLWFLVLCVQCDVLCNFVIAGNVFVLILMVVINPQPPTYHMKRPVELEPAARTLLQPSCTLPPTYSKPSCVKVHFHNTN